MRGGTGTAPTYGLVGSVTLEPINSSPQISSGWLVIRAPAHSLKAFDNTFFSTCVYDDVLANDILSGVDCTYWSMLTPPHRNIECVSE